MIKHELHQVPVTALAFSKDYLFAGEGPILRIHRRHDNTLLETVKTFASQAIHGIAIHSDGIIVWGGHLIALYTFTSDGTSLLGLVSSLEATDWILDVSISPERSSKNAKAALITAHNALLLLDLDDSNTGMQELTSNSKCILYSAHVHWTDNEHILVASGTVFGNIIVWSCILQAHSAPSSVLHHVLNGHEGSIFGVQIFEVPAGQDQDGPSRLLASCSDDRTVRIWDISSLPDTATDPQAAADLTSARETGFGANFADVLPGNLSGGRCIAKGWGHASRIWGVKFIPSQDSSTLSYVVSFGEDTTHQFWSLEETTPDEFSLSHLGGSCLHSGKNIWSWAIHQASPKEVIVASGGADGSVAIEPKSVPFTNEADHIQTWSIQDLVSLCPDQSASGRPDMLRSYAFLGKTELLVTTNAGNILLLTKDEQNRSASKWICNEQKLRGYSVVTSVPTLSIAFLAGMDGSVMLYDGSGIKQLVKSTRKTAALFAQRWPSSNTAHHQVGLLVANVEAKMALFSRFDLDDADGGARSAEGLSTWRLTLPKGFVITSFLAISLNTAESLMLVLGSRSGSIAIFNINNEVGNDDVAHQYLLDRAHGVDSVTDLAWFAEPNSASSDGHVFSVGKDGTYAVHSLSKSDSSINLRLISQTTLPLGTNIEGLQIDEDTNHLLVWGFHSRQFIVFDATDEIEIMNIDCGGANRIWKFEPEIGLQGGYFVWTKASQLCLFSQIQQPTKALNRGSHGREIKSVAVAPRNPTNAGVLFATGSEDTNIKLFTYQSEDKAPHFHCLKTLRKHNTGIRQLEWSSDGHYLFSSGGFEEFFVWRVETAPLVHIGVVCESVCPTESKLPDLRIMSFSCLEEDGNFIITMVRSDSTLRVYQYRPGQESQWSILMAGNYLTSCLTQCLHVQRDNRAQLLITAGTDGHVTFFPLETDSISTTSEPSALRWVSRSNVHQNTIHSIKLHWFDNKTCLLVTGGDDNAIAFSICAWHPAQNTPQVSTVIIPRAHAAAVTGVEVLASSTPQLLTVASTSIDQRVKIWGVHYDSSLPGVDGLSVTRTANYFTAVADVSDLAALDASSLIVCGVGMDVWSYSD